MDLGFALVAGFIMFCMIAFILWRLHTDMEPLMRIIAGSVLCDVGLHVIVISLAIASGSAHMLLAGETAGVGYSILLARYRKRFGYRWLGRAATATLSDGRSVTGRRSHILKVEIPEGAKLASLTRERLPHWHEYDGRLEWSRLTNGRPG